VAKNLLARKQKVRVVGRNSARLQPLDEPVLYLEDVDHHSVGQEIALWFNGDRGAQRSLS
jgi:hypothetical protein